MQVSFKGKPSNYGVIDNYVSRSAQPKKADFAWLKQQGVTDVINFRTMFVPKNDFDEKSVIESLGMRYHNIPSYTDKPTMENVDTFFKTVDQVVKDNGKVHIHCAAGADRTGMYAFLYKMKNNIGTMSENIQEWLKFGHHKDRYPDLIEKAKNLWKNIKK